MCSVFVLVPRTGIRQHAAARFTASWRKSGVIVAVGVTRKYGYKTFDTNIKRLIWFRLSQLATPKGHQMEIKLETFEAHTADPAIVGAHYATKINGTVEVVFNKKTIRVYANQTRYGFYVYGFCGKYRTGTKIWNATVSLGHNGKASATFGRDEVNSNCYKINGVFYAPEIFFAA